MSSAGCRASLSLYEPLWNNITGIDGLLEVAVDRLAVPTRDGVCCAPRERRNFCFRVKNGHAVSSRSDHAALGSAKTRKTYTGFLHTAARTNLARSFQDASITSAFD